MSFMNNPPDGKMFKYHKMLIRFIWKASCNHMHMQGSKMDFQICSHCCQACSCMNWMLYCCFYCRLSWFHLPICQLVWLILIQYYKQLNWKTQTIFLLAFPQIVPHIWFFLQEGSLRHSNIAASKIFVHKQTTQISWHFYNSGIYL